MFDHYKELFGVILRKESICSLVIRILGLLPMLVGGLGAIAGETTPRPYDTLDIKLAVQVHFCAGPLAIMKIGTKPLADWRYDPETKEL